MARGRSNWVVTVLWQDTGDEETFGPYTAKQAEEVVSRAQRHYDEANVEEPESATPIVGSYPLIRWEQ